MRNQLIDRHGRKHSYLRVSVTDRCNLRCTYCMPEKGVELKPRSEILTIDEIARLVNVFTSVGFTKVRLTGGEPLVRKGIVGLAKQISEMEGVNTVGITTNGILLTELAHSLKAAGVNRLNLSIDSLKPERFAMISRRDRFNDVRAGIDAALDAQFDYLRLNVVLMGGVNDDELVDFVEFVQDKPICVRFIEYMPFGGNNWGTATFIPAVEMMERIAKRYELERIEPEGKPCLVAKEYRIDGFTGTVGFITAMSEHFCSSCNRMRLTSDGRIKSCLYFPPESSLRDTMRAGASDDELAQQIQLALDQKCEGHPTTESLTQCAEGIEDRSMSEIGG